MEVSMKRMLVLTLLAAGCAQMPSSPEDVQAKRFEAVPGRAVVYVVRSPLDSQEISGLVLGESGQIGTQPGTYYRWEVGPGTHRVAGSGPANESVTLNAAPGGVYFLEHTVIGDPDDGGVQFTALRQIGERDGRNLVTGSQLLR
jgi:hypothetical protein